MMHARVCRGKGRLAEAASLPSWQRGSHRKQRDDRSPPRLCDNNTRNQN
jgi:hypothetical protein